LRGYLGQYPDDDAGGGSWALRSEFMVGIVTFEDGVAEPVANIGRKRPNRSDRRKPCKHVLSSALARYGIAPVATSCPTMRTYAQTRQVIRQFQSARRFSYFSLEPFAAYLSGLCSVRTLPVGEWHKLLTKAYRYQSITLSSVVL
jgi:hypothetical protein